ncbi:transcriptional regulator, IclR family [Jatrophihabitans endophyticus]|uniref:Glycerol operon regulatory protein n=1 Tax=Jatrophihabitans endophyticus TaxID=1206085 RepID=A0A1M5N7C3_9ACTN|nr:IclR family transcriptional regulator [Jatrophihabitans endophyticus]SHG85377.1 transcriptional regulator, IclR family [Jatrophihabitans endophyticus]
MTKSESAAGVQSVERALVILDILARSGEAGVTTIAQELGVHKSTAQRLVSTLEQGGLVEQTTDRGKYRLGVGVLRLAGATAARLDVVAEARPICRRLAADTGETVNVAVLSEGAALYVDQIAGSSTLQPHNWVGQRIPLHATSNGKILLSELADDDVERTVRDLRAYTPFTLTDRGALRDELAAVRRDGWASAVDELEVGLTAVGAPVRNAHGDVVASMSVSGPTFRLDAARVDEVRPLLLAAAAEASHRLGWG